MLQDPFQRLGLERTVLTVSQLNNRARLLLEDVFAQVWVTGEISNLALPASGHVYFTLKDGQAQVRCALFRQNALRVRQHLREGLAVRVQGKVSLYEGRGDYQLILSTVEPAGDGALRLAFEALKDKLQAEGLFDPARKKALPAQPKRIGLITSPSGAVIRDMISVFGRRAPQVELIVVPSAVQGREAISQLVSAVQLADKQGYDALIIARGGGSLEDLWCFNEEAVARAVAACQTPIVSAVGHETDVTICDFVADVRAPTPSAAAELLAPDQSAQVRQLQHYEQQLVRLIRQRLQQAQQQCLYLRQRLRHPGERLQQQAQRLDELELRLQRAWQQRLQLAQQRFQHTQQRLLRAHPAQQLPHQRERLQRWQERLQQAMQRILQQRRQQWLAHTATLQAVSPLATLERGYAIVRDEQRHAVTHVAGRKVGETLTTTLVDGDLQVQITAIHPRS